MYQIFVVLIDYRVSYGWYPYDIGSITHTYTHTHIWNDKFFLIMSMYYSSSNFNIYSSRTHQHEIFISLCMVGLVEPKMKKAIELNDKQNKRRQQQQQQTEKVVNNKSTHYYYYYGYHSWIERKVEKNTNSRPRLPLSLSLFHQVKQFAYSVQDFFLLAFFKYSKKKNCFCLFLTFITIFVYLKYLFFFSFLYFFLSVCLSFSQHAYSCNI